MKKLFTTFYFYYYYFWFSGIFLFLYPLLYYYLSDVKRYPSAQKLRRFWAQTLFLFMGIRYKIVGEKPNGKGPFIFVANHSSEIDIPAMCIALPYYLGFLAKVELNNIPILNIFFRTIDIQVDRENNDKSIAVFKKSIAAIKHGQSLIIYPEGGIDDDNPGFLHPFKEGAFSIAIRQQIPIVPVSMPDNHNIFDGNKKIAKPGRIRIILHEPIPTVGLGKEDANKLSQQVFNIISKHIPVYKP